MDRGTLILLLFNFCYVALLPVIFFKKSRRLTLGWFLTALPFGVCPLGLIASYYGYLPRLTGIDTPSSALMEVLALCLSAFSLCYISYTIGSNRVPLALWHQEDDAPQNIVSYGAYKYIRHPFYSSFIVAQTAAFVYCPQAISMLCLIYTYIVLNITAEREEKRLSASEFGEEYKLYMGRTGRFLPRFPDPEPGNS